MSSSSCKNSQKFEFKCCRWIWTNKKSPWKSIDKINSWGSINWSNGTNYRWIKIFM